MDLPARTRLEVDTLETAKSDQRCPFDLRKLKIKLNDLVACQLARVGDRHFSVDGLPRRHGKRGNAKVTVAEGCIAQPISEWVQRPALEITIGPVGHTVIFKMR